MKIHNKKILDKFFKAKRQGTKLFEFRKNDCNYQVGDLIHYIKTDGSEYLRSGKDNLYRIIYLITSEDFNDIPSGYCIYQEEKILWVLKLAI